MLVQKSFMKSIQFAQRQREQWRGRRAKEQNQFVEQFIVKSWGQNEWWTGRFNREHGKAYQNLANLTKASTINAIKELACDIGQLGQ